MHKARAMKALLKRNSYWLKGLLSVGLLIIVFYRVEWSALLQALNSVTWWFYPVIFCLSLLNFSLATLRWRLFLPTHKFAELFRLSFVGIFFSFTLPSSLTGDVAKVAKVDKKESGTSRVIAGVVVDRLLGLLALFFFSVIAVLLTSIPEFQSALWIVVAITSSFLGVILLFYTSLYGFLLKIVKRSPLSRISWFEHNFWYFEELVKQIQGYFKDFRLVGLNFMYAIITQFVFGASYLVSDIMFSFNVSIIDYFVISAVTQLAIMLPISIGGIGVKEVSFVKLIGLAGIDYSAASAASLVGYPNLLLLVMIGWQLNMRNNSKAKD